MGPITTLGVTVDLVVATIGAIFGAKMEPPVRRVMRTVVDRLLTAKEPANHDLQLAVRRAYIQATLVACDKCIENLHPSVTSRELDPKVLLSADKNKEAIRQLDELRKSLCAKLNSLDTFEYLPPTREAEKQIELLLGNVENGAQLSENLRQQLKTGLLAELRSWQSNLPEQFVEMIEQGWYDLDPNGKLVQTDWFNAMCAFFVNYLKTDQNVQHIFTDILLAKITVNLEMLEAKWEQWGTVIIARLDKINTHLERLRQEQKDEFGILKNRLDELRATLVVVQSVERQQEIIKDLLSELIRQHDLTLSDAEKETLVRNYFDEQKRKICEDLFYDLGPGNHYVEPLIEKRENQKLKGKLSDMLAESYSPIEIDTYFTKGPDRRIAVVADSGYGKTTLLKQLFLRISKTLEEEIPKSNCPIPIYLSPSEAAECSESNILGKIEIRLMACGFHESKVRHFVQDEFDRGDFIFLIDALDQISTRQNLMGALEGRAFRNNRVVVTTRPNIWKMESKHLQGYVYLLIREFDETRWEEYLGEERFNALKEIVDEDFFSVPILLRLAVEYLSGGTGKLERIRNRADLYKRVIDELLRRHEDIDAVRAEGLRERKSLYLRNDLQKLAHDTLANCELGQFPRGEALAILEKDEIRLDDLEARQWILEKTEEGEEIGFRHRSFQEYFATEYLRSKIKTEDDLKNLDSYLYHPNWEESIRFLVGLLPVNMAESLIERVLNLAEGKLLSLYRDHLRFAALLLREMGDSGERQSLKVVEHLESDLQDSDFRDMAISILAILKSERGTELLIKALQGPDPDYRGSVAVALRKIRSERAVEPLIRTLKHPDPQIRRDAANVLVMITSECVVESLIKALEDPAPEVRSEAVYALGGIKPEGVAESLIKALEDPALEVRSEAVYALGEIKPEGVADFLIKALQDPENKIRLRAAYALGKIKSEKAVEPLIKALQDPEDEVRWEAAYALGKIKSEKAVEPLIKALQGPEDEVRRSAASALVEIKSEKAVEPLINALQDPKGGVRWWAAHALGETKSEKAVESLIKALQDPEGGVRWKAAYALRKIKSEKAVEPLIKALQDPEDVVRWSAADALGEIKSEKSVEPLIKALQDPEAVVRGSAARVLGVIKSEKAVESLLKALQDPEADVRERAAGALGEIRSDRVVEHLIKALMDPSYDVRESAEEALQAFNSEQAVKALIKVMEGQDYDAAWRAMYTLENIASELAVEFLINALQDPDPGVRWKVVDILGKIRSERAVEPLIKTLQDPDPGVRRAASYALGGICTLATLNFFVDSWKKGETDLGRHLLLHDIQSCDRKLRSQQPVKTKFNE
jgi:HEAT repeat protein